MTTRREITLAFGLAPWSWAGGAWLGDAQAADVQADEAVGDHAGPLPTYRLDGGPAAGRAEVARARRLLLASPRTAGDVRAVARYFESLMEVNELGERYNAAWAQRWNPLIVGFHKNTALKNKYALDAGDTVRWGAAFLNWCLAIAGCRTTRTATSAAFRSHGRQAHTPHSGDIVVFTHADRQLARQGRGHVGLYMGADGDQIRVLGANRRAGQPFSSVSESLFPVAGDALVLHSFRSVASLQP